VVGGPEVEGAPEVVGGPEVEGAPVEVGSAVVVRVMR